MDVSEIRLEKALEEYNDTVNTLEGEGPSENLVEAYVNRGCVLYMMDYMTSAMEDLTAAAELIEILESEGVEIDSGTYVKAHATIGSILFEQNYEVSEAYSNALLRLDDVDEGSRHYDREGIIRLCLESSENLLDCDYPEDAMKFIDKGLSLLSKHDDAWSSNRKLELLNLKEEAFGQMDDGDSALEAISSALELGYGLLESHRLEDMELLIAIVVTKADREDSLGMKEEYVKDLEVAIKLMEESVLTSNADMSRMLVSLYHDIANSLVALGRVQDGEAYLVKALSAEVKGAKESLEDINKFQ